jgi:hypothetical protein
MSNKQEIQAAVAKILSEQKPPLETALEVEIAQYEHSLLELKLIHKRNLTQLLEVFEKRGAADTKTAKAIKERLAEL